ncbi:MAG: hypothetical protein ACWA45_03945 [Flavobacteriales bacterium]
MMFNKNIYLLSLFFIVCSLSAQNKSFTTLDQQFDDVINKSNSYQEFKVVKKIKLNSLRKNVNDSIISFKKTITDAHILIEEQKKNINSLKTELANTQNDLAVSIEKEDGINFFGILTKKSTYNLMMWSLVGLILALLLFLFYKYKNSHAITKKANLKLKETEEEFENHKRKSLEREQQLRRKLQDEINKNRNVT